jgi:hypothetical protein
MLTHKYISSYDVIRRIIRDSGLTHEIPDSDAIEWASESVSLIGTPLAYIEKCKVVEICEYRGKIPCDLHEHKTIVRYEMPICSDEDKNKLMITQILSSDDEFTSITLSATEHFIKDYQAQIDAFNNVVGRNSLFTRGKVSPMRYSTNILHSVQPCESGDCEDTYTLNNSQVVTNFKNGYVLFVYYGFPIDDCGFPLIPDVERYIKAVQAYVQFRIDYILWRRGDLDRAVFEHSEREWMWYVGSAKTKADMPNSDKMESIKNNWLKLYQKVNQHQNFFGGLGESEKRINNSSKWGNRRRFR